MIQEDHVHRCRIYEPQTEAPGKDYVELWDTTNKHYAGKMPEGEPNQTVFGKTFAQTRKMVDKIKLREGLTNGVDWEIRGIA